MGEGGGKTDIEDIRSEIGQSLEIVSDTSVIRMQYTQPLCVVCFCHCNTLQRTATHCTALYFTAAFGLEHLFNHLCYLNAIHSATLAMLSAYVTATRCKTLQHTALNCNLLQYTVLSTFSVISVIRIQYTQPLW